MLFKLRTDLNNKQKTPKKIASENLKKIEIYNKTLNTLTKEKNKFEYEKNKLYLNSLDSQIFISELIDRLERLDESEYIQSISNINFEFCPSCLSRLTSAASNICNLCKCESKVEADSPITPLLRMKNELLIQIEESKKINDIRDNKVKEINIKINHTNLEINSISAQLNDLTQHWSDDEKINISNISFSIGQIDAEIKEIEKLIPLYDELSDLNERIDVLDTDIDELNVSISTLEEESYKKKKDTILKLNSNLMELLKKDIPREKEFQNPKHVNISFSDNQISINNKSKFSESSMVILRHLFHLALLKTADEIPHMRFPRFVILDGIDDGGNEPERNIRLQELIIETINSLENSSQIIVGTSIKHLHKDLKPFIYNDIFNAEDKSLKI